jgi:hypothetical protein
MSWFLSPSYKVNLSEDREIPDSDDGSLPSVREILKQKEVIDLTADEEDVIEVSGLRDRLNTPVRLIPSLVDRQLLHCQPANFDPHRPHYRTRRHRLSKTQ